MKSVMTKKGMNEAIAEGAVGVKRATPECGE
jgi:hypothetical protein